MRLTEVNSTDSDYRPGDVVFKTQPRNFLHLGIQIAQRLLSWGTTAEQQKAYHAAVVIAASPTHIQVIETSSGTGGVVEQAWDLTKLPCHALRVFRPQSPQLIQRVWQVAKAWVPRDAESIVRPYSRLRAALSMLPFREDYGGVERCQRATHDRAAGTLHKFEGGFCSEFVASVVQVAMLETDGKLAPWMRQEAFYLSPARLLQFLNRAPQWREPTADLSEVTAHCVV